MLEIGPKIMRFYLSYILFFMAIFNFSLMSSACGLLRNKRYINKLLLLFIITAIITYQSNFPFPCICVNGVIEFHVNDKRAICPVQYI